VTPRHNDIRNGNQSVAPTPAAASTAAAPPGHNDIRNATSHDDPRNTCPVCQTLFTPIRRQTYCTPACRQAAWRARHPTTTPAVILPPHTPRRDYTVYSCPLCGARRLGQQWCPDCNHPATRVDLGGLCPHCDEPVAISDLTSQHPRPQPTSVDQEIRQLRTPGDNTRPDND
jgi:hypothetical protein